MYDTVELRLSQHKAKINLLDTIPKYLSNITKSDTSGFITYTGQLEGLTIRVNENNVKILGGSLCKYQLGNNIETMFRSSVETAIKSISDKLHLPFENANVTRLDIAHNLLMKHDEVLYFPLLGNLQFYKRQDQQDGLYFSNHRRKLAFYQKIKEQKAKQNPIPSHLKDANLIRYEFRLLKRLTKHFNKPEILASDLYDEDFYIQVADQWKDEYFKIQKVNSMVQKIPPLSSTKEMTDYLAIMGLSMLGIDKLHLKIKEWQKMGNITKKQASDLRKKLKFLNNKPTMTYKNDLIEELDKKVLNAIKFYR